MGRTRSPVLKAIRPALLLAIRPEHARRIYSGKKSFELRKFLPRAGFERVFMSETGGHGVSGCFEVKKIHRQSLDELWRLVGERGTTRERFDRYFAGFSRGHAIEIGPVTRWPTPMKFQGRLTPDSIFPRRGWQRLTLSDPLNRLLHTKLVDVLAKGARRVSLRPLQPNEEEAFAEIVTQEIARHYDGIDSAFAQATLRSHRLGRDPNGFITIRKEVLVARGERGRSIGYTCLTFKTGGAVKTGPTILIPAARRHGYGQAVRRAIEAYAVGKGARKLYCTCPDVAFEVSRYLISAGMKVEAHLDEQYANGHGELVFGKLLRSPRVAADWKPTKVAVNARVVTCDTFEREALVSFLGRQFPMLGLRLSRTVLHRVVAEALLKDVSEIEEKPKRLVCLASGHRCVGAAVLVPKRGGAVKGILLRETAHKRPLTALVRKAEEIVRQLGGRKLYFVHPTSDGSAIALLREGGYQSEGLLRSAYRSGIDAIVLSKPFQH